MVEGRPDDYAEVIRANQDKSLAVILADEPACIDRWGAFAVRGRRYEIRDPLSVQGFQPPHRCLAIIVACPGDDLTQAIAWCRHHDLAPARIRFIVHPDCDQVALFRPWYTRYEDDPIVSETTSYPGPKGVQASLGRWYNDWIYLDAQGLDWPGTWQP